MSEDHSYLIDIDLRRNDDGSYSGNHHGYFPDRSTVDMVFSGKPEKVAYKEGPARDSTLYRNCKTGEYYEVYWARGCGEPFNLPVDDPIDWLRDIGDHEAVRIDFIGQDENSGLVAVILLSDLRRRLSAKADEARMSVAEWIRKTLEEAVRGFSDPPGASSV